MCAIHAVFVILLNRSGLKSMSRSLLLFAAIMILPAVAVLADGVDDKENGKMLRIPLKLCKDTDGQGQDWKVLGFKNRLPNKVVCDEKGLHIKVRCSANLLVYGLDTLTDVNSVVLEGVVAGLPRIPEGKEQGGRKADDFAIRFGLVIPGKKRLNAIEKLFAPELVRHLFAQAPKSQGLDHVLFLNLANDPPPKWKTRIHPIGKGLLREQVACVKGAPGEFILEAEFQKPCEVLALCIICDGDHTKSEFQVTIKDIRLNSKRREEQ
ncbi:MAG: hypothetical protein RQ760_15370 [Sedimentisphaerales bacterium]|nr:hypothetical protein [Sedimentisphaerales bacterium]